MLKLTRVALNHSDKTIDDYQPVWINPAQIRLITREIIEWGEFTTINLGNQTIDVKETPEEIAAMPEMLNAAYPMVTLPPTGPTA